MAIRKVARMGHPVLQKPARRVSRDEIATPAFARLLADMRDTMEEYGGIGLAAPQIHESVQVAIIGFDEGNERYPDQDAQELKIFINPEITVLDETLQGFWEGCLSVPGLRGFVERPRKVQVDYLDEKGAKKRFVAEDFLATVVQHELDHLFGTLYVERISDRKKLMFQEEFDKYRAAQAEEERADEPELPD
jgi:peptide deformylase